MFNMSQIIKCLLNLLSISIDSVIDDLSASKPGCWCSQVCVGGTV